MIGVSILDLVPVVLGETPREALPKSLDLVPMPKLWLHALLGGRTSQHDRHCQRRHLRSDRVSRRRHLDNPRGFRRHHAAKPFTARNRRTIWHARIALPGPDRPGPGPRARHRSRTRASAAPRSRRADSFLEDVLELQSLLGGAATRPTSRGVRAVPVGAPKFRSGFWARVHSAPSSPQPTGCLTLSRRTSHPIAFRCARRFTGNSFKPVEDNWIIRMRWLV